MSDSETAVYDPQQAELDALSGYGLAQLDTEALATPTAVSLILGQLRNTGYDLKTTREQLRNANAENSSLAQTREELRVALAQMTERASLSWLEALSGIVAGFAASMLTQSVTDPVGWLLLVLGLSMLFILKRPEKFPFSSKSGGTKEGNHGTNQR